GSKATPSLCLRSCYNLRGCDLMCRHVSLHTKGGSEMISQMTDQSNAEEPAVKRVRQALKAALDSINEAPLPQMLRDEVGDRICSAEATLNLRLLQRKDVGVDILAHDCDV